MHDDPIALCVAGAISPEVAIARLLLAGLAPADIIARLASRDQSAIRVRVLRRLLDGRRDALKSLSALVANQRIDHAQSSQPPAAAVVDIARLFDAAVVAAPEASVAFYSLNDPAILRAATDELIAWLSGEDLIGPDRDVLDLGCGIGRVAGALAASCRSVRGLDISPNMIAEACRRHGALPNVVFAVAEGAGLQLAAGCCDLVLAADVFPYLFQAGREVAQAHVRDIGRVLRAGGSLAILNLSYSEDPATDRRLLRGWAAAAGMRTVSDAARPFRLWDADAYVFRK